MEKLILGLALIASSATHAAPCKEWHEVGKSIMDARQSGVSLPVILETAGDNDVLVSIIKSAYREPVYMVEENKRDSVDEFANKVMLMCLDQEVAK